MRSFDGGWMTGRWLALSEIAGGVSFSCDADDKKKEKKIITDTKKAKIYYGKQITH